MICTCIRNEVGWIVIPDINCRAVAAVDPWRRDVPPDVLTATQDHQHQDDDRDNDQDGP